MATRDALCDFLRELIAESEVEAPPEIDDSTSLLASGLLDSHAVLQLAVWIEESVGSEIDLEGIDFHAEWDSVPAILAFVAAQRGAAAAG